MAVKGLTRENVASHLQKHRLRIKREGEDTTRAAAAKASTASRAAARAATKASGARKVRAAAGVEAGDRSDSDDDGTPHDAHDGQDVDMPEAQVGWTALASWSLPTDWEGWVHLLSLQCVVYSCPSTL